MIRTLKLQCGRAVGSSGTTIDVTPVTVFVGPNNSGKSRVLREIEGYCRSGTRDAKAVVVDSIEFEGIQGQAATVAIDRIRLQPNPNESQAVDHVIVGSKHGRLTVPIDALRQTVEQPHASALQNFW